MTLVQVTNQVVGLLCEKDVLTLADCAAIKVPEELADAKEDLVRAALEQLAKIGMIAAAGSDRWILTAPLNAGGQEVHLSMQVCNEIADVINTDLEAKDISDRVDALNIHEGHVVALLSIINELLSE